LKNGTRTAVRFGVGDAATRSTTSPSEKVVPFFAADSSLSGFPICEPTHFAKRHTILLVEDESFVRQAMAAVLRSSGYTVLTAAEGSQALAICRNCAQSPDLLISDQVMPGMSGDHLATLFEALHPWGRVLLMSGYSEKTGICGRRVCGAVRLRKPFSICTLIREVRKILNADGVDSTTRVIKA
jgi:DNA-binding NtrC family response regulator